NETYQGYPVVSLNKGTVIKLNSLGIYDHNFRNKRRCGIDQNSSYPSSYGFLVNSDLGS
ncbi:9535_t:CDS:1, partial [Dentiscutata erythropus]